MEGQNYLFFTFFAFYVGRCQLIGVVVASKELGVKDKSDKFAFP